MAEITTTNTVDVVNLATGFRRSKVPTKFPDSQRTALSEVFASWGASEWKELHPKATEILRRYVGLARHRDSYVVRLDDGRWYVAHYDYPRVTLHQSLSFVAENANVAMEMYLMNVLTRKRADYEVRLANAQALVTKARDDAISLLFNPFKD